MSDIIEHVGTPPAVPDNTIVPVDYIALALERDNLDALERAISIRDRELEKQAESQGRRALAKFQAECPPIPKGKEVKNRDGSVRYTYAPLDEVLQAIRPAMAANGLSVRWESEDVDGGEKIRVTCIVTHEDGYQVRSPQVVEPTSVSGTNSVQARGSAVTYGKRYSMQDALGIVPVGVDDDARSFEGSGPFQALLMHNNVLRQTDILNIVVHVKRNFMDDGDVTLAAEAYSELDRGEIQALWLAPTKGGIWTTDERKRIKSDEEFQAEVQKYRESSGWHERNPG